MPVKINSFEIENVKRVKAVALEPTADGLTVIGGRNGQGKTSVLDAIAWALGGERYRPSEPGRAGSMTPPYLKVELSNGIVVERKGKNSDLKVYDPSGRTSGQTLLNSFISQFALDLPGFLNASGKEKARTLLEIIGAGDRLAALDAEEERLYNERHYTGQVADRKRKHAVEMESFPGVPSEPVSASELIREQQEILARNGQRQQWIRERDGILAEINAAEARAEHLRQSLAETEAKLRELEEKRKAAEKTPKELEMESTEELEAGIRETEALNAKIRANLEKARAEDEADELSKQYEELTDRIERVRAERTALLDGADQALPGLSVEKGELVYNGAKWDCMSSSDQMRAATAIVRRLNPECGFVLLDKLEQMDTETLSEFGEWLEAEGLQAIATRVSTGGECSVIIEDGRTRPTSPEEGPDDNAPEARADRGAALPATGYKLPATEGGLF